MPEGGPRSRRIAVPASVLAGLAVTLLACLLAIAWLLGRESGRRLARDPGPPPTTVHVAPGPAPEPPATLAATPPPAAVPSPTAAPPVMTPAPTAPPAAAPEVDGSGEAVAVARYFDELEALSSARYWDDPRSLAMSLVQELAGGSTAGLERLQRVQAEVAASVRRMAVPAPCREHHRRSLELFDSAGRLLRTISAGAASGDLTGLMSATAEAERLQAGAEELREMENRLRDRYGLPAAPS